MNNFFLRLTTGILYVTVTLAAIIFSPVTAAILFLLGALLSQHEFLRTFKGQARPHLFLAVLSGAVIYSILALIALGILTHNMLGFLFLPVLFVFIAELYRKKENPFLNIGTTLISFVYLVIPFALLNFIYAYGGSAGGPDYTFILSFFIIVWINDSLAYLTGLLAGRNKLFARISPKKTWEGFAGGFLFSMAAGAGFAFFFESPHIAIWLIYAACIAIFATFGDLIESMLKRNFEVKDSGSILPGHGGMLDRFDGVLLASPAVFLYLNLI